MEVFNNIVNYSSDLIYNGGLPFGIIFIILESFIPVLPLGVMVALIANAYGLVFGIVISWISNIIGCYLVYLIFYYLSDKLVFRIFSRKTRDRIDRGKLVFKSISFSLLTLIVSLPFTPSSLVNLISGVAKMSKKKYLCSLLIGKIFNISFWAYIGKSFIESMSDLKAIIALIVMLLLVYIISKIVSRRVNMD